MTEKIGEKIKRYRKNKKLTLDALAKRVGSSSGYLSEVETGKKQPGSELLLLLQRELEFPLGTNVVKDDAEPYGDPLRVALEDEIKKLSRPELAKLLHQLLEQAKERDD